VLIPPAVKADAERIRKALRKHAQDSAIETKPSMLQILDTLGIDIKEFMRRTEAQKSQLLKTATNLLKEKAMAKDTSVAEIGKRRQVEAMLWQEYHLENVNQTLIYTVIAAHPDWAVWALAENVRDRMRGAKAKDGGSLRGNAPFKKGDRVVVEGQRGKLQGFSNGGWIVKLDDMRILYGVPKASIESLLPVKEATDSSDRASSPHGFKPTPNDSFICRICGKTAMNPLHYKEVKVFGGKRDYGYATDSRRTRLHRALDAVMDSRGGAKDAEDPRMIQKQFFDLLRKAQAATKDKYGRISFEHAKQLKAIAAPYGAAYVSSPVEGRKTLPSPAHLSRTVRELYVIPEKRGESSHPFEKK
jgi:hypothetical protein